MWNWKIGNLRALALGYVQRKKIPADLPVKTTDDVDQGGGCGSGGGDGRKRVSTPMMFLSFCHASDMAAHELSPPFFISPFQSLFYTGISAYNRLYSSSCIVLYTKL